MIKPTEPIWRKAKKQHMCQSRMWDGGDCTEIITPRNYYLDTLVSNDTGYWGTIKLCRGCGMSIKAIDMGSGGLSASKKKDLERGVIVKNEITTKERNDMLIENDLDWYVVDYTDGDVGLVHRTGLSSILDCGHDMGDYDIVKIEQCWNGDDLSEC